MKKIIVSILIMLSLSSNICFAGRIADSVGVDRIAHASCSYVICDQLKRNCGFNDFWAAFCTLAIGAAKEKWIDKEWDNGDFAADCLGVLTYQISF